ncbi:MAG: hypothetical protein K2Y37_12350 [Pirellulales bacterium]|nr:hypothetical protein [Pirellulales bacterium]
MRSLTIRLSLAISLLGYSASARGVDQQRCVYWWPWRCKTPEVFPHTAFYGYYPTCWKQWQLNCPNCPPTGGHPQHPYDGMIVEGPAAEPVAPGAAPRETLPDGTRPTQPGEGTLPPVQPLFPDAPPLIMPENRPTETPGEIPDSQPIPPDEAPTDLPPTTPDEPAQQPSTDTPSDSAEGTDAPAETPGLAPDAPQEPRSIEATEEPGHAADRSGRRTRRLSIQGHKGSNPSRPASPSLELLQQTLDETRFDVTAPRPPLTRTSATAPEGTDLPPTSDQAEPATLTVEQRNSAPARTGESAPELTNVPRAGAIRVAAPTRQSATATATVTLPVAPAATVTAAAQAPRVSRSTTLQTTRAARSSGDAVLMEPADLVRMASSATVAPQPGATSRPARRPQTPVVECARAVRHTSQAIGTVAPSNQASQAGYVSPASPRIGASAAVIPAHDSRTSRSVSQPPVVQPIGAALPSGQYPRPLPE